MDELFKSLDLADYLAQFKSLLAREKPLFIAGDSRINYEKILEICAFDITPPAHVENLDDALQKISKQGVLHISEIWEFAKIIRYFLYLKRLKFEKKMGEYLAKIVIPDEINEIVCYFDDSGCLRDEIDERFVQIRQNLELKKAQIATELRKLISTKAIAPYLVDNQIHLINESETLLVRGGFNRVLKGSITARSAGGFFYVIPSITEKLKSEQSDILDKKEELIYEYCKKISSIFNKNLLFLKFINTNFDLIDALVARAIFARTNDYNFVLSDSSKDIKLCEFAHPALKNPKRISIDFTKKVLLITGVNAGGKSMLLKSLISACLLSKYLLPFSVKSAKIGTFKEFELIIEDPQNVRDDISTFAGRMVKFSRLFNKQKVIVGIDEIELGTDFEEAANLYEVLITNLMKNDAKIIITTHHKRLAMLLAKDENVELIAALYDEVNSKPKFEFLSGVVGKSYAFETALRYGISQNMVALAKQNYGENKENLNILLTKTLNLESELRQKLKSTQEKEQKLQHLIDCLADEKERLDLKIQNEISRLEREYFEAIKEAKKAIVFDDFKEKQRALNSANEMKKRIKMPSQNSQIPNYKVGDRVKYEKIKGEILSLKSNEAMILSDDGVRLRVPLSALKRSGNQSENSQNQPQNISTNDTSNFGKNSSKNLIKGAKNSANLAQISNQKSSVKIKVSRPQNAPLVLDLHGLRSDEAIEKLDKFISDSLVVGYDEVIVKHGIGTGKLAYAVREFLKSHPFVKGFCDATPQQGGYGSKVIKL